MWGAAELRAVLDGAMHFERPLLLWLSAGPLAAGLTLALLAGPWRVRVPRPGSGRWSPGLASDLPWLLSVALRGGAIALLAAALARPVGLIPENPAGGIGVDLLIALDASGSMKALDAELDGSLVTRLDLAKRVVADFVEERGGDRIGLVAFGERAFTQCPLTVDHRLVLEALERIEVGVAGDATALGEAIGLAARRMRIPGAPDDARRVVVLVTDGRHNSGRIAPETAARVATLQGIRIHAVGIGSEGVVPFAQDSPGEPLRFEQVDLDRETLRAVAAATGGRFFHAEQPEDLRGVIDAIDQLEARPLPSAPRYRRASLAPLALLLALSLLLAEAATTHGVTRRLP